MRVSVSQIPLAASAGKDEWFSSSAEWSEDQARGGRWLGGCGGAARGWGEKQEMKKPMPEPLLRAQQGGLVPGRLTVCSLNWRLGPLEPSTLPALSTQAWPYLSCE